MMYSRHQNWPRQQLLVVLFIAVLPFAGFAQNENYKEFSINSMLPTSPEAASLGRFGDIPVGHYTGTSEVSIPLYTIKESGLEIPIMLRYHNGGIRVSDQATDVGLGWSLEPGGAIIQIVNGTEDRHCPFRVVQQEMSLDTRA